jgi:hypothetical protein
MLPPWVAVPAMPKVPQALFGNGPKLDALSLFESAKARYIICLLKVFAQSLGGTRLVFANYCYCQELSTSVMRHC